MRINLLFFGKKIVHCSHITRCYQSFSFRTSHFMVYVSVSLYVPRSYICELVFLSFSSSFFSNIQFFESIFSLSEQKNIQYKGKNKNRRHHIPFGENKVISHIYIMQSNRNICVYVCAVMIA